MSTWLIGDMRGRIDGIVNKPTMPINIRDYGLYLTASTVHFGYAFIIYGNEDYSKLFTNGITVE